MHAYVVTQQDYVLVLQRSIARLVTITCSLSARWVAHLSIFRISVVLINNTLLGFHEHRTPEVLTDSGPAGSQWQIQVCRRRSTNVVLYIR